MLYSTKMIDNDIIHYGIMTSEILCLIIIILITEMVSLQTFYKNC